MVEGKFSTLFSSKFLVPLIVCIQWTLDVIKLKNSELLVDIILDNIIWNK